MHIKNHIVLIFPLLLSACATTQGPSARVNQLMAAESTEATRLRSIAVLPFEGPQGNDLAYDIESVLAGIRLGNSPYFQVVERKKLAHVFNEIKLSQTGLLNNKEKALELGKILHVQGIYIGNISTPIFNENNYQESRSQCTEHNPAKGFLKIQTCKKSIDVKITCKSTEVTHSFTPKLIDVTSGRIIYSNTIKTSIAQSHCPDSDKKIQSNSSLLAQARQQGLEQFRKEIAPISINSSLPLMDNTEEFKNDQSKQKFLSAIEFAKAGRMHRACDLWNEVETLEKGKIATEFNLAICAEANGDLEKAKNMYLNIEKKLSQPNNLLISALNRIDMQIANERKMQSQLHRN